MRQSAATASEVLWPGCAALVLWTLLACCLAQHAFDREHGRLQEARRHSLLLDVRRQVEAELALGFDLADSQRAERLLEGTLHGQDQLLQATVFDASGQTLFDTDRSAIGEQVPDAWQRAAGNAAWRVADADTTAIGLPLHGPFGIVVGHVALTLSVPGASYAWPWIAASCMAMTGMAALLAMLPLAGLSRALDPSRCDAGRRLDDAEARMTEIDTALRVGTPAATR